MPASQTTTVGFWPCSVSIFTSIEAKPKIAFVGRPWTSRSTRAARRTPGRRALLPSIRKSSSARGAPEPSGRAIRRSRRPTLRAAQIGPTGPCPDALRASTRLTIRVEIDDRPGMLGQVATAIGEAGGDDRRGRPGRGRGRPHAARHHRRRGRRRTHWDADPRGDRRRSTARTVIDVTDRTFLLHVGGKIEHAQQVAAAARATTSRWPTRRASRACAWRSRDDPHEGLPVHDQAQHGRRRHRRHRGARASATSAREAAMPVMEGKAMLFKEFARRRRLPDLPRHEGPRRDRRDGRAASPRRSAASTSRTSRRRAASRSRTA